MRAKERALREGKAWHHARARIIERSAARLFRGTARYRKDGQALRNYIHERAFRNPVLFRVLGTVHESARDGNGGEIAVKIIATRPSTPRASAFPGDG